MKNKEIYERTIDTLVHENTNIEITEQTKRKFYGKAKNGAQASV